jgi:hypothetical protein
LFIILSTLIIYNNVRSNAIGKICLG